MTVLLSSEQKKIISSEFRNQVDSPYFKKVAGIWDSREFVDSPYFRGLL